MKHRELTRKLRRLGCEFRRRGKGSHEIWWNPETGGYAAIPLHKGKDIPTKTFYRILRELGISLEELHKA